MGFFKVLSEHFLKDQGLVQCSLNDRCLFVKYKTGSDTDRARRELKAQGGAR
jgi:hypothetical protein